MFVSLKESVEIIKKGEVVAFPTETVYGLGADATNSQAIAKVFAAKNRPADNPLICHFYSVQQVCLYVPDIPKTVLTLIKGLTPGCVSFLLPLPPNSPLQPATAGQNCVIIRIPDHPIALDFIKKCNVPLVGPSANTSGRTSATNVSMIEDDLGDKIAGILDGGSSLIGVESTILDCTHAWQYRDANPVATSKSLQEPQPITLKILRPGAIGAAEILAICNAKNLPFIVTDSTHASSKTTTPGSKYPHYSPVTPVFLFDEKRVSKTTTTIPFLYVLEDADFAKEMTQTFAHLYPIMLGSTNNMEELARNFYQKLASIDSFKTSFAVCKVPIWPNTSLGKAISNRLQKVLSNNS